MSNIIEKITLYDLLGYTIPGTILLSVCGYVYLVSIGQEVSFFVRYRNYTGYLMAALIILGYVIGIAMSEITYCVAEKIKNDKWFNSKNKIEKIGYTTIAKALKRAGMIQDENVISNFETLENYIKYMYGIIQVDSKYARLHNYASSELICRNMSFVAFTCGIAIYFVVRECTVIICGIILTGAYMCRWRKQYWAKKFYTVSWFVEKYTNIP